MKAELMRIAKELVRMIVKKNRMYGNSYFELREKYGPLAFVIRISDKVNRIESLANSDEVYFESYEDTVRDIAGYALLELVYLQMKQDTTSTEVIDTERLFRALVGEGYPFEDLIEEYRRREEVE